MTLLREKQAIPTRIQWILLIAFGIAFNLLGLGAHGLFEPDEGRYANMAVEWLEFEDHHWAAPVLSDIGHFDKPPLIYWITGTCLHFFGLNETAARLPSFLGSLLTLIGVGLLAYRQYGERSAFWAVLVCLTTLQFWALAHLLSPDMVMCGFCTLGAALTLWGGKGKRGWLFWSLGAIFWALAWWTKATAALVPLGAITAALLITGRQDLLRSLKPIRLLLVILVLGSPWYVAMMIRHEELRDFFLHREIVGRVVGHVDGRKGFPGYHFVVALGFWLPWWPVLAHSAWMNRAKWKALALRSRIKLIPWEPVAAIAVLLIFSSVSSKLITYTLPGVPFLAIATGRQMKSLNFSIRHWPARIAGGAAIILLVVVFSVHRIESSIGGNSSVRKAVEVAKENGAQWLVCDDFLPGIEFYIGEAVWYVNVADIAQVQDLPGQSALVHFVAKGEIETRVNETDAVMWLIQTRENPLAWARHLVEERPEPETPPLIVGDFKLWRVK